MKKIFFLSIIYGVFLGLPSCSKCYNCEEIHYIEDGNGNIIDSTIVHDEICTADRSEIDRREQEGAKCSI